jgi:hypothetical protein
LCDRASLEPRARRSFALYARLPKEIGGNWGYRRLTTYGGFAGTEKSDCRPGSAYDFNWLSDDVTLTRRLGSAETTAQVHPRQFTAAMMRAAEAKGAKLRLGRVTGVVRGSSRAGVTRA